MSDYRVPRQRAVEIGEHMDGVGVVLDPDNEVMASLMESIGWQRTVLDPESARGAREKVGKA